MCLEIKAEKCTGCRICTSFCSFQHEGAVWPEQTRITVAAQSDDGPFAPNVCRQCEDAACAAACPVEAIVFAQHAGAWIVDTQECIGCGACVQACPHGAMFFDPDRDVAFKCDLCGGEPQCAAMCPSGAITLQLERL